MKKIYLLILLVCVSMSVFAARFFPNSIGAPSGGITTYCVGQANDAYSAVVTMCPTSSGGAGATNDITAQWYWNGVLVYTDPTVYTPASAATYTVSIPAGVFNLTPVGTYAGTSGLHVRLTSSFTTAPGGCTAGPVVTGASTTITVSNPPAAITGFDKVCKDYTITLANTVPGGTWSSSTPSVASVSPSGVVTGLGIGGVAISYSIGNCVVTHSISVNGNPDAITPSGAAVCAGGTTTLSNTTGGGSWISAAPAIATAGSGTGIVSGATVGVTTISYVLGGSGCYALANVTVNPNPAAPTGTMAACIGSTTTLSNSTAGGMWTATPGSIATIGALSGVVTGVAAGTARVTYTLMSTSCYSTTIVTVGTPPAAITGRDAVCAGGDTIGLSNTINGGAWSSSDPATGSVTATGIVTGLMAGVITISYATPGCSPATKTVTVSPLPAPISGSLLICTGVPSVLFNSTTGGVFTTIDTFIATVEPSGHIMGVTMGTANVTYTMPGGCRTVGVVTVNPLAPITGPDTICAGGMSYLSNIVGGGTWSSGNPLVLDIDDTTGVMSGIIAGPSYVVYSLPTGCSASKLVTVIPALPAISGADVLCVGATVTLANTVPGGTWSTSNAFVGAVDDSTGFFVAGAPDTVRITYTTTRVGCSTTKIITVSAPPVPVITYSGMSTHILSTFVYFVSYQWYDSTRGLIPGATNPTLNVMPDKSEYYYVVVTDIYGCTGHYGYQIGWPAGVGTAATGDISVYPNPARETLHIGSTAPVSTVISDMAGRMQLSADKKKDIDISSLPLGVYMVTLYDEQGMRVKQEKLVKQ